MRVKSLTYLTVMICLNYTESKASHPINHPSGICKWLPGTISSQYLCKPFLYPLLVLIPPSSSDSFSFRWPKVIPQSHFCSHSPPDSWHTPVSPSSPPPPPPPFFSFLFYLNSSSSLSLSPRSSVDTYLISLLSPLRHHFLWYDCITG